MLYSGQMHPMGTHMLWVWCCVDSAILPKHFCKFYTGGWQCGTWKQFLLTDWQRSVVHVLLQWRNSRVWRKGAGKQGLDCACTICWSYKYSPILIDLFFFCVTIQYLFRVGLVFRQNKIFPWHFSRDRQAPSVCVTILPRGVRAELGSVQVCLSGSDAGWVHHHFLRRLAALSVLIHTCESLHTHPY